MARYGRGVKEIADALDCTEAHVTHIRMERARPSLDEAHALERITGIPASAWVRRAS